MSCGMRRVSYVGSLVSLFLAPCHAQREALLCVAVFRKTLVSGDGPARIAQAFLVK